MNQEPPCGKHRGVNNLLAVGAIDSRGAAAFSASTAGAGCAVRLLDFTRCIAGEVSIASAAGAAACYTAPALAFASAGTFVAEIIVRVIGIIRLFGILFPVQAALAVLAGAITRLALPVIGTGNIAIFALRTTDHASIAVSADAFALAGTTLCVIAPSLTSAITPLADALSFAADTGSLVAIFADAGRTGTIAALAYTPTGTRAAFSHGVCIAFALTLVANAIVAFGASRITVAAGADMLMVLVTVFTVAGAFADLAVGQFITAVFAYVLPGFLSRFGNSCFCDRLRCFRFGNSCFCDRLLDVEAFEKL